MFERRDRPEKFAAAAETGQGAWTEAHFGRYRPSTRAGVRSALSKRLLPAFGGMRLHEIRRPVVLHWFEAASRTTPGVANFALDLLRQILNFAVSAGHLDANPARGLKRNRRTPRTRFLSRDEVRLLHRALDELAQRSPNAAEQADVIRLLLLTGCRRGEIVALRWCEVAGDTLALCDAKTGPRRVPLCEPARAILRAPGAGDESLRLPVAARRTPPPRRQSPPLGRGPARRPDRGRSSARLATLLCNNVLFREDFQRLAAQCTAVIALLYIDLFDHLQTRTASHDLFLPICVIISQPDLTTIRARHGRAWRPTHGIADFPQPPHRRPFDTRGGSASVNLPDRRRRGTELSLALPCHDKKVWTS